MRNVMNIVLAAGLAFAGAAHASVLTYQFTAKVDEIIDPNISLWSSEGEGALSGSVVRSGQTISGRFSYDNASPLIFSTWGSAYFASNGNQTSYAINSIGQQYQSTAGRLGSVTIANSASSSYGLSIGGSGSIINAAYGDADTDIFFADDTRTKFQQNVLPTTLDMHSFSRVVLSFNWHRASDGKYMMGFAYIDTLNAVHDVPEPASLGLVLAGLTAFGASRRRVRRN